MSCRLRMRRRVTRTRHFVTCVCFKRHDVVGFGGIGRICQAVTHLFIFFLNGCLDRNCGQTSKLRSDSSEWALIHAEGRRVASDSTNDIPSRKEYRGIVNKNATAANPASSGRQRDANRPNNLQHSKNGENPPPSPSSRTETCWDVLYRATEFLPSATFVKEKKNEAERERERERAIHQENEPS